MLTAFPQTFVTSVCWFCTRPVSAWAQTAKGMATLKCLSCKEEILGGSFVNIPAGPVHEQCFLCPCCGTSLLNKRGYLPYKVRPVNDDVLGAHSINPRVSHGNNGRQGNFVCSVNCRTLAVRDPALLLQTSTHWRQVQSGGKTDWAPSK